MLLLENEHLDGDMDKRIVQKSDNQTGFAGHGGVHSVARIEITEDRISSISGAAPNQVARVEIPHDYRNALLFKVGLDSLAEEQAGSPRWPRPR